MSGEETFEVHSMACRERDITFRVGRGQQLASLCYGRGRSMSPSAFNYTVDQPVVDSPLAPSASSTPLTQSTPKPTQVISVEALGDMITDWPDRLAKTYQSISAPCTSLVRFSLSLQLISHPVMLVYRS